MAVRSSSRSRGVLNASLICGAQLVPLARGVGADLVKQASGVGAYAFPEPVYELRTGKLWLRAAIEAFASRQRKPGRPRGARTAAG
jgi:hypothetical protein